jgi:methionyl-tRNA formyltransferase
MNIMFCAYREWAVNVFNELREIHHEHSFSLIGSEEEFFFHINEYQWPDVIVLVGWSWIVPAHVTNTVYTVGFHPSDLPEYAGGSPIQHQVLDGVEETMGTLYKVTSKLDAGPMLGKQELNLSGSMKTIFINLSDCAVQLINNFLDKYPNVPMKKQATKIKVRKRLKPSDSELTLEKIKTMSCKKIYDFIRCREDPYPNVFMEDETGKIFFKRVGFEPREEKQ